MNEENTQDSGTITDTQTADTGQVQDTTQQDGQQQRHGGFVDFNTATPEEIGRKFSDLYGQVKQSKRALGEFKDVAAQQAKLIADLTNGVGVVVDHLQQKSFVDTEAQLMQELTAAHTRGDSKAFLEAQTKLIQVKAEKIVSEKMQPRDVVRNNAGVQVTKAPTHDAVSDMSPQESQILKAWVDERDESGRELRPWAFPHSPDYENAYAETQAVFTNSRYAGLTMDQKLAEVDKRMGVKKPAAGQSVMGGSLTNGKTGSKITLSPDLEKIAIRTKFGGPKAKTDADHIEAYRQQMVKVKSQGGRK